MAETNDDLRAKFKLFGWKALFLLGILFGYLTFGAILLHFLEHDAREGEIQEAVEELEEDRAQLLKVLWAGALAKSEDDWTLFANERMDLYETQLVDNVLLDGVDVKNPEESDNPWSWQGSFFYCFTIVTTIGYGNIAPATASGKVATIIYGLIGIPMTLYLLSVIGKFLTICLKISIRQFSSSSSSLSDEFDFGLPIIVGLLALCFATGAALFGYFEEWDWLDAGYFSFITFTTIGLGDMVPDSDKIQVAILSVIFIFTALSLFSMIFTVFQQSAETYLEHLFAIFCNFKTAPSSADSGKKSKKYGQESQIPLFSYQTTATKNAYESNKPASWSKPAPDRETEVEEVEVEEDQT